MKRERLALRRRGFALPAAIIALVLLSALVAGALFVSTEELRSGRSDLADQRALAAAEWALDRAIVSWDSQRNIGQPAGATAIIDDRVAAPNERIVVTATRVQRYAVWMTAAATSGVDGRRIPARHAIAASLRLVPFPITARAALTAAGSVTVDGGQVDGRDSVSAGDSTGLCATGQPGAGIAIADPNLVTCVTCSSVSQSGVFGSPPIDSGVLDSSSSGVDEIDTDSLASRATIVLDAGTFAPRPSSNGGACDRADALNWGDPTGLGPCAPWYPVIYVRGDAVLASGSVGQGILVVRGRLRLEANARFVGVVIASGGVDVIGVGAEIDGVVFAGSAGQASVSRVSDGAAIRLATCAVRRATLGAARLERTAVRWWAELR